ncbi:rhomboid-like protein [Entomortierella parvispora]|uniref:Rhomboid-like protein n=1 Tax=Entomortierella parvispora TaxID=205924 RepID=A0A9P3H9K1_9FUNG|nr:rhomboid-like protein [Entomortierella parvispora]
MSGTRPMSSLINARRPQFRNVNPFNSSKPVVYSIVAVNVAIFVVWQYAEGNATRFRDGRLLRFMFQNFSDSEQNLREGRIWTLLTSTFSHREWYHILLNMMVLVSFGDPVWRLLGTGRFMAVYVGSGIASSLASVLYYQSLQPYLRRQQNKPISNSIHYSLGASGSIMGITTAFACVYPMAQYSLFFILTMPAAALIGLFGAYELYNVLSTNTGRFDSAGHLGGGLFGAAYYLTRLRPYLRKVR